MSESTESSKEKCATFRKGEVVAREGLVNAEAWMVRRGSVALYRVVDGRRVVLARFGPGDFFGENPLLTGKPATATAVAEEPTELLPLGRDLLQTMLLKSPNPVQRMLVSLAEQLQAMHGLEQLRPAPDMFASLCSLLDLAARAAKAGPGNGAESSVGYEEYRALATDIVSASQLEVDTALETLARHELIQVQDPGLRAQDKRIQVKEPGSLAAKARALPVSRESHPPRVEGPEHLDLRGMAEQAGVWPQELRSMIGQGELPEALILFPRNRAESWLWSRARGEAGPDDGGETLSRDITAYPDRKVQRALMDMEPAQVALLFAAAPKAAKVKLLDNMSEVMGRKVRDLAKALEVNSERLARAEADFFRRMRLGERMAAKGP